MNGVSIIVILRSLADGSVLDAITPGTVHPKPINIGTILLPESPIFLRSLSITKAILAIYPLSSKSDKKKNRTTMIGIKLSTLPTPPNMPSITNECSTGFTSNAVSQPSTKDVKPSIAPSSSPCNHAPITLNVSQKIIAIMPTNAGIAVYLPVRILSILWLLSCSLLSLGLTTVVSHSFLINANLMSAMAAALSRPLSSSICSMMCSIISCSLTTE